MEANLYISRLQSKMSFDFVVKVCTKLFYKVSQQVWDVLNVMFWSSEKFASEASYVYKKTQ